MYIEYHISVCVHVRFIYTSMHLHVLCIPILSVKSWSVGSKLSNLAYTGLGNNHKKRWLSPFSALPGNSIRDLATLGWLNPPTVRLVLFMEKFASPVTVEKQLPLANC